MAVPLSNLSATWATSAGTTNTAIKMNVTDTASAAASKLIDLQVNDVSKFSVSKAGVVTATGYNGINLSAYVLIAGDTMTGDLTMSSANVVLSGTTSQFLGRNDGASRPSFSWTNNPTTGMYNPGSDIGFVIASSETARVTTSDILVGNTAIWSPTATGITSCAAIRGTGAGYFYTAGITPLEVSRSTNGIAVNFYSASTLRGTIVANNNGTFYTTASDYRLKENFTIIPDPIERTMKLRPLRFNFIESPEITVDGFIAHEVQEVVPEAATGQKDEVDDNGKPVIQGLDHSKLVPLLTAALQQTIKDLKELKEDFEKYKLKHP